MKNITLYINKTTIPLNKLAKKTGIDESRLRGIRGEEFDPTYTEVCSISEVLKLPVSFLLSEYHPDRNFAVLFRKTFQSDADSTIVDKFSYLVDNVLLLEPDLNNVEQIRSRIQPVENTYTNADMLSFMFREIYFSGNQLDPLTGLPEILSNKLGFIVKVLELGNEADGASALIENFVFLFVSPRFEGRMLFTLAHELAHIINHHGIGNFFYFDKKISLQPRGDTQKVERFANAFASCLLLPELGVARMVKKIREIHKIPPKSPLGDVEILFLARYYGVSFDVAAHRCESLNLIPQGAGYSISQKIKEDYGSPEKRADELGLPPRSSISFPKAPNFILDKAITLIEEGKYSVGKIADMLSIPVKMIIEHRSHIA